MWHKKIGVKAETCYSKSSFFRQWSQQNPLDFSKDQHSQQQAEIFTYNCLRSEISTQVCSKLKTSSLTHKSMIQYDSTQDSLHYPSELKFILFWSQKSTSFLNVVKISSKRFTWINYCTSLIDTDFDCDFTFFLESPTAHGSNSDSATQIDSRLGLYGLSLSTNIYFLIWKWSVTNNNFLMINGQEKELIARQLWILPQKHLPSRQVN